MAHSLDRRRLRILLLAIGCVVLVGLPVPGATANRWWLPHPSGEPPVAAAGATMPDENAGMWATPAGAAAAMRVPLPACGIAGGDDARAGEEPEGQQPQRDTPAPRDAFIPTMSDLPVRYTLSGAMTQTIGSPAAVELARREMKSDSTAASAGRPRTIVPLYISMTALQVLDIVSTQRALMAGATEANPLVAPLVGSTPMLVAVKAGVSGAMIYMVERLWKQNRKAAILMLIGTNIGYAAVVSHNFAQAAGPPGTR